MISVFNLSRLLLFILTIESVASPDFMKSPFIKSNRRKIEEKKLIRVGILAHELTNNMKQSITNALENKLSEKDIFDLLATTTQISSNYIKFVKENNFQFYPILVTNPMPVIIQQLYQLDGILLPGGAPGFQFLEKNYKQVPKVHVKLNLRRNYFKKVDQIIETAKYINKYSHPFVVFGICLGFEMMILNESRFTIPLEHIENQNINKPIELSTEKSFFSNFLNEEVQDHQNIFSSGKQFYYNSKGISVKSFQKNANLVKNYKILADYETNTGKKYVSIIENTKYPFFGVQFHPEKNLYDNSDYFQADHSNESIKVSRIIQKYFLKLFENRKELPELNKNLFVNSEAVVFPQIGYYNDLLVFNKSRRNRNFLTNFAVQSIV